ncbi:SET domain-containing protein-lysine N-methyltransferase [Candidatus Woesearchaeota archaeon]|nr:SET domain-containing protein-lysine N-methyltransferase [Candidatus Woesearchaeota archaeon]
MTNFKLKVKNSAIDNKGLFADEDIPANSEIIEYTGEIIDNAESDRREELDKGVTYIAYIDDNTYIDGAIGGNDSKYLNHSCNPNCIFKVKNGRLYYYSKRLIKKGEELTADYAFPADTKKEICRCGSKNCRGFMNELI